MRIRRFTTPGLLIGIVFALGCSSTEQATQTIPVDTAVLVALDASTSSSEIRPGTTVVGRLADDIVVDGAAVISAGPPVSLRVVEAQPATDTAPAMLTLELSSVELPAGRTAVATQPLAILGEPALVVEGTTPGLIAEGHPAGGEDPASGAILGTMAGDVVMTRTEDGAIVLPAGQRLLFSTTAAIEIPRG